MVLNKVNMSVFGAQAAAKNLLNDWRKAANEGSKYKPVLNTSPRQWSPPPQGYVRINTDAATFPKLNCIGVGNVIRDEYGSFLRARGKELQLDSSQRKQRL